MKKSIFMALSITLASVTFFSSMNAAHANSSPTQLSIEQSILEKLDNDPDAYEVVEKMNKYIESDEFQKIKEGLEKYNEWFYLGEKGYEFKKDAKKEIPKEIYKLLEEVFESANEEIVANSNYSVRDAEIQPMGNDEGHTYYGDDHDTYVYIGPNFDVGEYWYFSDDDTRWLVEKLLVAATITWFAGKILSLFPYEFAKKLSSSADVAAYMIAAGAAVISNKNKGYGVYVRIYSKGTQFGSRNY
ncbi:hypothetical protein [Brevibacillus sp. AY1]|uniref:hypothetical protein n=1 Tax=Brevibacillus sp. AY1 TaxID=2807621 RepID=UPI002457BF08|nr:hypothetical protein [Brevibacillus sp. AY1]MDH4620210.1 hypothetical protein [Brevibacillus sp. AY1]